ADGDCLPGNFCDPSVSQCVPLLGNGAVCTKPSQCGSTFCTDGRCCPSACSGQCQSCATGACQTITGAPVGKRPSCNSDGSACGGTCDGANGVACSYPTASAQCRTQSCTAGVLTQAGFCA